MNTKPEDRRLIRSRRLLGNALIELMQEKRYIDITVQDIIDRADVGRTTFYTHFRDKEDLLISSLELILENFIHHMDSTGDGKPSMERSSADAERGGDDHTLLSTADFFRHVKEHQDLYKAMLEGAGMDLLFTKGQAMMSQKIEQHLDRLPINRENLSIPIPVLTNYLAGSFLVLLKWWVNHKMAYSPEQMDAMYQQLVMPGTLKALGVG